jgi:DNA adenine methylase
MKPIVKYQGGKSKELPLIKEMLPKKFNRVIEPFAGGAAVSFGLNKPSVLNDINWDVINLYITVADSNGYAELQDYVDVLKTLSHNQLEKKYYDARDLINSNTIDPLPRAKAYVTVRQLCFSGMERYNSYGAFNVPFGHYQKFSCNLSKEHHNFLKNCDIQYGDFSNVLSSLEENDFAFIDPPYLDRLGYIEGDGGEELHNSLFNLLDNSKSKWMVIHSDSEFYRDKYKGYNIVEIDFQYAQRFGKNKNHSGANVKHLYITNYKNTDKISTFI